MRAFSTTFAALLALGASVPNSFAENAKPVSFHREVMPIFKKSCTGCHHPGKKKGDLDLTTYAAFKLGGKGGASFATNDVKGSMVIAEISGPEPSMPKEGDPLTKEEIALIERWISEGANDDTPAQSLRPSEPPVYHAPPVISAMAYSPNGDLLAVSGYHEVLLHKSDGSGLSARLLGDSPRVESVAFSPDGKLLAVSGGAPSLFGEIQIWSVTSTNLEHSFKISPDSLYGVSFSPDSERIAFGGADKSVRVIAAKDGKELFKFDNHSDWVFATSFTVDGKRLLSGSRDRAMKLIDASNAQFIDDINKLLDEVLGMARHPKADQAAYVGLLGTPRIYRISENQGRTAANNDVNLVREFERQPVPLYSVAFSPDGSLLAVGGMSDEVRIYKTADGSRAATLKGHEGSIFSIVFHPKANEVAVGGYDGKVRIYDPASGKLLKEFSAAPLSPREMAKTAK